jgi:hypothetical protein
VPPPPPKDENVLKERKKSPVLHRDMQADLNDLDEDSCWRVKVIHLNIFIQFLKWIQLEIYINNN